MSVRWPSHSSNWWVALTMFIAPATIAGGGHGSQRGEPAFSQGRRKTAADPTKSNSPSLRLRSGPALSQKARQEWGTRASEWTRSVLVECGVLLGEVLLILGHIFEGVN